MDNLVIRRRLPKKLKLVWSCRTLYLMLLPVIAYYVIFKYIPMYGVTIAFKDYNIFKGAFGSPRAGLMCSGKFSQVKISGRPLKHIGIESINPDHIFL